MAAVVAMALGGTAGGRTPSVDDPIPSLEPRATGLLWQQLVTHPRAFRAQGDCRPLRGVFYAATDWLRLATKLAANASPCAQYYISIPPVVADKTTFRPDQAWRIRALGANFHALAEFHWTTWSRWVASTGSTWYDAGVEARRRMAEAGFDVGAGDTWVVNEFPSTVRTGAGSARTNAREVVRGLYEGAGSRHARGVVLIVGIGQQTNNVSVYQTNLQNWLADQAFWTDMSTYVSDWSQEAYGDVRRYAVPETPITTRRDYLNDYLQYTGVVARAGPPTIELARTFLSGAFSPVANAAWQWDSGYGFTNVSVDTMKSFVSAQVYALRSFSVAAGLPQDHWGFAWQPRNTAALPATDFASQTGAILDRLGAAIRDSAQPVDPNDPGSGACGPPGQDLYCEGDLEGAQFTELWKSFRSWSEPVLTFTTSPQELTAGQSSDALGVSLISSTGEPQLTELPVAVGLASSSQQGRFSLSPGGPWTTTLAVAIPAGSSSLPPVYYSDTHAAQPQVSAKALGATTATQLETVAPGPLAKIRIEPSPASLAPYRSRSLTTVASDAFGNSVPPAEARWTVRPARLVEVKPESGTTTTVTAGGRGGSGRLTATAGGGVSAVTRLIVSPGTIHAPSIRYEVRGRRLRVTATVLEARREPARAVLTSVTVRRNGIAAFSGRKRTDRDGRVTYVLRAEKGCYRTTVTEITGPGYRWNGKTPRNRLCVR
jgi:hypothetical protein